MSKHLLKFDFTKSNSKEDDILIIRFQDEDTLQINFSKLISQSKYIRDKYKYSEALESIQPEIDEIMTKYNINEETIKLFIQLIQDEKINIPIEHYKDFYTLSEHFNIPKFTAELDKISHNELFSDLNFTIQILQDSESAKNDEETKLTRKIENFLIERINECIENEKFKELPVPTICRIIEHGIEKVDNNSLVDFIFESADTRFVLIKFVEFQKLTDEKVKEFIKLVDEQDETTRKTCSECMQCNFSFFKNIINRNNQLFNELNETRQELDQTKQKLSNTKKSHKQTKRELSETNQELNQTKQELNDTKQEFDQTKQELNDIKQDLSDTKQELSQTKHKLNDTKQEFNQTKQDLDETKRELNQTKQKLNETEQELNQTKQELNQTKQELNETEQELNQTKQELNQTKQELNQTKQELNQTKQELNQTKQELNQTKQELNHDRDILNRRNIETIQCTKSIIACGRNKFNQLIEKPNNKNKNNFPIIDPPVKLSFDHSSLLSYSVYYTHSVLVTNDGSLKGIGDNKSGSISDTLPKTFIKELADFNIYDSNYRQLSAVSAVCNFYGTLYMLSKSNCNERQLVLCDYEINESDPVFLDIGNHHPVSLFGGNSHSAAIGSEGEVIFINRDSVKKSPNSPIPAVFLPDGEKASSIACCTNSVVVLSLNGRVFSSPIKSNEVLDFSPVLELLDHEIVCLSGVLEHCLAVSKNGSVFGRGSNFNGQLGLGKKTNSVSSFTKISELQEYEIRAAYAGFSHSLFETNEGKILSCGWNNNGELLLREGPGKCVYSPTETLITSGASFCIAGSNISVVFIECNPPQNTPNMRIQQFK